MTNKFYSKGYDAGVKIACAFNNISPEDVVRHSSFSERFLADNFAQQALSKIATTAFEEAGMTGTAEYFLYKNIEKRASFAPLSPYSVETFIVPVVHALYKEAKAISEDMQGQSAVMTKQSALSFLSETAGKILGTVPELSKDVMALSALGGAGIGSLAWALNRDSDTDAEEADEKHAQAMHYKRIAEDLRKRLGSNIAVKKSLKNDIEDSTEGAYLL